MSTSPLFNRYALDYDSWYTRHKPTAETEVRALMSFGFRGFGMELGVGSGFFAHRLGVPMGLEPAWGMAQLARGRGVWVIAGVGELMPIRDGALDYILIVVTICFLDDPRKSLRESHRVLREGGRLVTCIVPRESPHGRFYMELGKRGHRFYSAAHFYTVREVSELLREVGFRISRIVATLSRGLGDYEDGAYTVSVDEAERYGFVCIEAIK
ncbi:class I SAM-dependent methyltransferase [Vulcanisaeta thermophila]|uniref:class I SAM-dependent methyltransferase n=1 Tax=Vulcanisaeta thermophila TaxID=867917 RepID=UPI000852DE8A|nr:class I SAM-dependent methyltransferase [Vulcanisaeta thermophila]